MNLRDIQLKQQQRDNKKADAKPRYRAVLCAADGSRTTGEVFADENNKTVWFQFFGSGGVGKALCLTLVPELGLGVYVTPTDDKLGWEVTETDKFLRQSATDGRNYETIAPSDLQPGGRLMLWVDSRQISPLATYDTAGTLLVNVVAGSYPYLGTRKNFAGQINIDLSTSQPAGPTEHRYVGLYLDSTNTFQTVDGTAVSTALAPPEPTWPAGAFRLSVVRINDTQTSFSFADDIQDRRMAWSDENGGGSGWPLDNVWTVSSTNPGADYSTIAAAITGASAGDTILLDTETFTVTTLTISKAVTIIGLDPINTIITSSTNSTVTVDITAAGVMLRNLTINWTGTGTAGGCIQSNQNNTILENVNLNKTSGAASLAACYVVYGGMHRLTNCHFSCTAGTNRYGIYSITASTTIIIENGEIGGSTYDLYSNQAGAVINLNEVILTNKLINWSGTVNGWYKDNNKYLTAGGLSRLIWTPPAFSVHKNGTDQTGIVTATLTKVTWSTENYDTHGWFDSDKFTPQLAGNYFLKAKFYYTSAADQTQFYAIIYKNGSYTADFVAVASGTNGLHVESIAILTANGSTDYFEAYAYHTSGVNRTIYGGPASTTFEGFYIGQ